jgi:hypothetical protein
VRRAADLPLYIVCLCAALLASCSSPKDLYRVSWIRWEGDSIALQVVDKQATPQPVAGLETEFDCLTCNLVLEPWTIPLDQNGIARFWIPEAKQMLTTRVSVRAHGIDTPAVLNQRPPEEATRYYKLAKPLTGRVLLLSMALLYVDSTYDSVAVAGRQQDEINIYSEQEEHYLVHHPLFEHPLYLRKLGTTRVR